MRQRTVSIYLLVREGGGYQPYPPIVYTRVSSREQQQEGFSLGAQAKLLREYADRNGFQIVKAFEDVETAKASGRVQFSEMMTWFRRNRSCRILLVEKTDWLYRNHRDAVILEDLDIETHLVKEGQIISKDAKSQAKLIHGIHLVMAKNYSENLREEVRKGMHEKLSQGGFPGHAPFGYRNNRAERTIEIDPIKYVYYRCTGHRGKCDLPASGRKTSPIG
jgi:DNA invertase Pin-like site-specific DNA recombinase